MAMGLAQVKFCDFIVFTFCGIVIVRIRFDEPYFKELVNRLNIFYKQHLLPEIIKRDSVI